MRRSAPPPREEVPPTPEKGSPPPREEIPPSSNRASPSPAPSIVKSFPTPSAPSPSATSTPHKITSPPNGVPPPKEEVPPKEPKSSSGPTTANDSPTSSATSFPQTTPPPMSSTSSMGTSSFSTETTPATMTTSTTMASAPTQTIITITKSDDSQIISKLIISLGALAGALIIVIIAILIFLLKRRKSKHQKAIKETQRLPSFHEKRATQEFLPTIPLRSDIRTDIRPQPSYYPQVYPQRPQLVRQSTNRQSRGSQVSQGSQGWKQHFRNQNQQNRMTARGGDQCVWPALFEGVDSIPQYQDPNYDPSRYSASIIPPPQYSKYKVVNRYHQQAEADVREIEDGLPEYPDEKKQFPVEQPIELPAPLEPISRQYAEPDERDSRVGGDSFKLERLSVLRARERIGKWRDIVVATPQETEDVMTLIDEPVVRARGVGRVDLRKEMARVKRQKEDRERLVESEYEEGNEAIVAMYEEMYRKSKLREMEGGEGSEVSVSTCNTCTITECLASVDDLFI